MAKMNLPDAVDRNFCLYNLCPTLLFDQNWTKEQNGWFQLDINQEKPFVLIRS